MALESDYSRLKHGDKAPSFTLKGTDGKVHFLNEFRTSKALLVVFMCNHCPFVKHKIETIVELHREFADKGLAVVGINSNDPANYPEDDFEGMKAFAKEHGIEFPYLIDETQAVAKAYGASCTPDPFLFDAQFKLAYHGRFDDALSPGSRPTTAEMKEAIEQLIEGKDVSIQWKPSIGCSIKWKK
ncbi:MAG: thioredoxin family protein [Candidatus Aenigmarchaeota archaeon]|nr:thioredoxin family protein [Candidatus Aenigmarchaeota archaeon]